MSAPLLIYLHGFASGPGSQKAQFFRQRFGTTASSWKSPTWPRATSRT
jgi:predicted esterase YcpF (UPF0227 family)